MSGETETKPRPRRKPAEQPPEPPDQTGTPEAVEAAAREAAETERKPDPPPRKRRRPKKKDGPTDAELTEALTEVLALGAIPVRFVTKCEICAKGAVEDAPGAAAELVELAAGNEAFRNGLVAAYEWVRFLTLARKGTKIGTYIARPVVHHAPGVPEPAVMVLGPMLGLPPREPSPEEPAGATVHPIHNHDHQERNGEPSPPSANGTGTPEGSPVPPPEAPEPPAA